MSRRRPNDTDITSTPETRARYAAPYVQRIHDAFVDEDGNVMPAALKFAILEASGVLDEIQPLKVLYKARHITDEMSPAEQWEAQKKDLYVKAMSGDMQAKKLWFELEGRLDQGMDFNVSVKVVPYRVADESLTRIVSEADREIVQDMLAGLDLRLGIDEAPHDLRRVLNRFREGFDSWSREAYKAKDA